MPVNVLYVVGFPLDKEAEQFTKPKSGGICLGPAVAANFSVFTSYVSNMNKGLFDFRW